MSIAVDTGVGLPAETQAASRRGPLVGHDAELARLEETWSSVRHGSGRLVLLEGIAGSGKSRLVRAFLDAARAGGALVLSTTCSADDPAPFGPLRRAIDDLLRPSADDASAPVERVRDALGPFAAVLARFTPGLTAALGDVPDAPAHADAPALLVDGLAELLVRLPAGRQTVLVIDDANWLDSSTRRVLDRVLARLSEAPLLVLCSGRDVAPTADVDPRVVTRIELAATSADQAIGLIESHHLQRQLDDLDARARAILTTAAVIGPRVRMDVLGAAVPDGPGVVRSAVDAAMVARLVERIDEDVIAFTHETVRAALLASLDDAALRREHQQVGDAITDDVYAVAWHSSRGDLAGYPRRVYESNLAAGSAALAEAAPDAALGFFDQAARAAAVAGIVPDSTLCLGLADACVVTGRGAEAAQHLERALAATPDPTARAQLCARFAQLHAFGSTRDLTAMRRHLAEGYRELGASMPDGGALALLRAAGQASLAAIVRRVPAARWLLPASDETDDARAALDRLAGVLARAEASAAVQIELGLSASFAAAGREPSAEQSRAYATFAGLLGAFGWKTPARRFADLAVEVAQSLGDRVAVASSRAARATTLSAVGEALESEREHRRVIEAYEAWLPIDDRLAAATDLAWNLWSRGRDRDALAAVDHGLQRVMPLLQARDRAAAEPMLAVVEHLVAWQGRAAEAHEIVGRCAAVDAPRLHLAMLACARASVLLAAGDLGPAFDALIDEHRRLALHPMTEPLHTRLFHVYHGYACLQRCMRAKHADRPARLEALADAVAVLRRAAHVPVLRCHRLVLDGSLRRLQGQRAAASEALAAAEELAAEVDAPWAVFEIFRQRAYLLAARGRGEIAGRYAAMARDVALRQGWVVRAEWIETEFPSTVRGARPTTN